MSSIGILGLLAVVVLPVAFALGRMSAGRGGRLWALSWATLYVAAIAYAWPGEPALALAGSQVLGTLFATLLVAGSLAFVGRPVPNVVYAVGALVGLARAAAQLAGSAWLPDLLLLLTTPPAVIACAVVVARANRRGAPTHWERVLPWALVAYALSGVFLALTRSSGATPTLVIRVGLATSLSLAAVQAAAVVAQLRARERRLVIERELLRYVARASLDTAVDGRILEDIAAQVRSRAGFDSFSIWLLSEEGDALECAARDDDLPPSLAPPARLPLSRPLLRPNAASEVPTGGHARDAEPVSEIAASVPYESLVQGVLGSKDRLLGVVVAGRREAQSLDVMDARLVAALADEIALAVAHLRSRRERESHARSLAAERSTLSALMQSVPVGIVLVDRDGLIRSANRIGTRLYGLGDPDQWLGRHQRETFQMYAEQLNDADRERLAAATRRAARDPEAILDDLEFELTIDEPRRIVLYSSPVRAGENREIIGRLWFSRDVTEERRMSQDLERTRRLETLGGLAGGVAHDFNNQLTAILGNAELMLRTLPHGVHREALLDLQQGAEHCADLTRSLLDFARQSPTEPEAVSLDSVWARVELAVRSALPPDVQLVYESEAPLPALRADATQLGRALTHLLENASDAVGGRGRIRVAARSLPQRRDPAVEIRVSDTGVGMKSDVLERAFDPFFTTKPIGQGNGLGLAIVYGIVEAHGADVEMESTPGRGTTVRLEWPASPATNGSAARSL
ncbi:MAG: ATP-binding protein [Proteobacteria bacterium]|nr:ATP-binding protein [Pseudomonadota bacterium]